MGKKTGKDKGSEKTNVMRLLEQAKIPYQYDTYESDGVLNGREVAAMLSLDPERVFKTLVTVGKSGTHYVFVVPVNSELNVKRAAAAVGEKSIEMVKSKELLPLTGYVHGGCSPIGMKKLFPTVLHKSALEYETIFFSGGKIGFQVQVAPEDLKKMVPFDIADVADPQIS